MASFATEGESVADLFKQPDFWKSSRLLDTPTPLGKAFFDLIVRHKFDAVGEDPVAIQNKGYFKLPPDLQRIQPEQPTVEPPASLDDAPLSLSSSETDEDPWLCHDVTTAKAPGFKTWDGFDLPETKPDPATLITEAGTFAYDSFLASESNPCGIESNDSYETLDSRGYSACLLAMSLGRESVLYHWSQETKSFKSALPFTKVPGYTGDSLSSIVQLCTTCEWIGLKPEDGIRMSKDGPSKGFVRVGTSMLVDDQGFELEEPDYFLDSDNMPTFVPQDIGQSIFETGRNIRFLQAHHPQHPLSSVGSLPGVEVLELKWQYDWNSITRVEQKALAYHRAVSETLRRSRTAQADLMALSSLDCMVIDEPVLQFFGKDEAHLEETVLASIARLDRPIEMVEDEDSLSKILRANLFTARRQNNIGAEFSPHWSLLPLLSFGPLVFAQARLVNRECLRLLFREHGLRAHLRLQRSFQLFGNGMFTSRLSNSLFNPDMETTERHSGVARSGVVMGLRLADRKNWPPASSELRLALMGVLTDSYHDDHGLQGQLSVTSTIKQDKLPGDLSFGIRNLSPEEMEKCMDPESLEALDFLRLHYQPPRPLTSIMTPAVLLKYDKIFKLMLRVLRVQSVVDQLFRDVSPRLTGGADPGNISLRFRIEAHHFISNVARYFVDTGIERPWRRFGAWLGKVEQGLGDNDPSGAPSTVSPDRLGEQHERTLDEIMLALLLRKRQQPVLKLLEEIFTVILQFAKCRARAQGGQKLEQEMREIYKTFRHKVEVFISVCRGMTEKSGYATKINGELGGRAEENSIVMLLLLLDMSNYYTKR
ncbi:hypothetical protein VPNG_03239 [Cytospora leucostoma]|uniref:Spindle pole body component n=1 Tax=Cytospora leucostoma TaxID=1230097 RepID=A0A423XES3_9PEZI|nr:hypothetical protein VPNG_03239 [Cytospora leucostoma]